MDGTAEQYFLEVVKNGESPVWPESEEELAIGSQDLGSGYTQYWAYPKDSAHRVGDLPPAETLASKNSAPTPAILIDQEPDGGVSLILVKNGHAWGYTKSNLSNLEGNITTLLETAKDKFNLHIEHFMTTDRVSPEVERRLDELEEVENEVEKGEKEETSAPVSNFSPSIRSALSDAPQPPSPRINQTPFGSLGNPSERKSSALPLLIPIVVLIALALGALMFKDQIFNKLRPAPTPTPTPLVTPTSVPTPTLTKVPRSNFTVRVLNGTTQTGAAAKLATKLNSLGWKTTGVGNATNSAYLQTEVRAKAGQDALIKTLISDLAPDLNATTASSLKASDSADAEVVIGQK